MQPKTITKLKMEHRIVLQALEVVNLAYSRTAKVDEVIGALLPEQFELLQQSYTNHLSVAVSKILKQLCVRQFVFSTGIIGTRRFYGSFNVLNPLRSIPSLNTQSIRSRVLELVHEAIVNAGCALRSRDIVDYASKDSRFNDIEPEHIVRSILSLAETGELITKAVRGDGGGINLYLPHDVDPDLFTQPYPPTWLEEVAMHIDSFWEERIKRAETEGVKPCPFSTGEFRSYMTMKEFRFEPAPKGDPQNLVNALKSLSITRNPLLRRIKRTGEKACLWAPFKVPEESFQLGNSYASDAERVGMAVQRATERLGRPVKLQDINEEIELDDSLRPISTKKLFHIVSDAAKEQIGVESGIRYKRNLQRIYRIGRLYNETYYDTGYKPESRTWLRFRQLETDWLKICAEERISNLAGGSVPSILTGRAMLIKSDITDVAIAANKLIAEGNLYEGTLSEAEMLCACISNTLTQVNSWIAKNTPIGTTLPEQVNPEIVGMTAPRLLEFMKSIAPRVRGITSHNKLIALMKDNIRRFPNPNFSSRFSTNSENSSDYLYDRTAAFIYVAKHWGGDECCTQAMIADETLERLRDVRFVLPALESPNRNIRFAGIACLAFLKDTEGNELLRRTITLDIDPSVRRSSLWAYGFTGGHDSKEVFRNSAMTDSNAEVRRFAKQSLDIDALGWWML